MSYREVISVPAREIIHRSVATRDGPNARKIRLVLIRKATVIFVRQLNSPASSVSRGGVSLVNTIRTHSTYIRRVVVKRARGLLIGSSLSYSPSSFSKRNERNGRKNVTVDYYSSPFFLSRSFYRSPYTFLRVFAHVRFLFV